ncbi:MAG: hypothetical protein IPP28_00920 [Xanthomonadales bacterium]|nr:hypothetical protein [Xanthomonadales bacterium]
MWTAKQVPRGLDCGCVCPACKAPLVAKAQDSVDRRPHFAHHRETDCRGGFESAVHRMAKQLIHDHLRIQIPAWGGTIDMPNPPSKLDDRGEKFVGRTLEFPARLGALTSALLEVPRGDYVPDVTAHDEEGELLVEIRVRHAVGELKERRVQSDGVRMIEIDLSRLTVEQVLDDAEFNRLVLEESGNRHWVSYPAAAEAWRTAYNEFQRAFRERNQLIKAEAKDAAAKQALALSKERAKQANKDAARERMRRLLRAPHESMLACLHELTHPERVAHLLRERWLRDREQFEVLEQQLDSYTVIKALQRWHKDAWVYNDHPVYLQARIYRQFIQDAPPGSYISQVDAARWARTEIGVDPVLGELFHAQYVATMEARAAGYFKEVVSAWYFTNEENALIPSLYDPFDDLFARLVDAGAICRVKDGPHRYMREPAPRVSSVQESAIRQVLPTPVPVRRPSESHLAPGTRIEHKRFGRGTVENYLPPSSHVFAVHIDGEQDARMLSLDPSDRQWRRI